MIIVLALLLLIAAGFIAFKILRPAVQNKPNTYLYIYPGTDMAGLAQQLRDSNYITGSGYGLACKLLRFKNPKPGRYRLKDGMSLLSMVRMLRSGNQEPVKVVVNKERIREQFAGKMGKNRKYDFIFDSLQMMNFLNNNDSLKKFGVDSNTVMAIIQPDTYNHKWNSTPDKLMQQFYNSFKKFWNNDRKAKAQKLSLTPLQVTVLASIVEEETNLRADKINIASTYINRLNTGMKLQACPTIKFALKNFGLKRILNTHLETKSPFNTYQNAGLPPGPICTPSKETIDLVLNAPKTEYLYFVASYQFAGSSIFTTNYADHIKYAKLYQQELTRRTDSVRKEKEKTDSLDKKDRK
ncbi:MAG: endolytic transglycosylase MltG [Chitinophagaceae bacterium]|nr:endolytic transglycosylase MltG [Chitinophagaceae bacterium]